MKPLPNELKWSHSRMKTFDSCRRGYYYRYYLSWGGWETGCDPQRRLAYRLGKMTSLPILAGSVVHQCIENALRRWRNNSICISREEMVQTARVIWEQSIRQAQSGKWMDNPKQCCCLIEFYTKVEGREALVGEYWERVEQSIGSFYQSNTWSELQRSTTTRWLAMDDDGFEAFDVNGIPVMARPDLSYDAPSRTGERRCRVFDFKTGKPRDSDLLQIRYYALVSESRWGYDPELVKTRLVYLYPELAEHDIPPDTQRLQDARAALVDSFDRMKSVVDNLETNEPRDLSYFPVTTRKGLCGRCNFAEMCEDRNSEPAAAALSPDDEFDPFRD